MSLPRDWGWLAVDGPRARAIAGAWPGVAPAPRSWQPLERATSLLERAALAPVAWVRTGELPEALTDTGPRPRRPLRAPRISIIVPCHDGAATLPVALRSLRRQRVRDWEAIVVDDGSSDASAEVARAWMARDPRIRLIRQPQQGVAAARNAGLREARGRWVGFLDCDDWLSPGAFKTLLALAERRPDAGVVLGRACKVLPDGRRRSLPRLDLSEPFATLCSEGGMAIHSVLVRRELVARVGGFDPTLKTSEDWDLWQRLARCGVAFAQSGVRVAFYRNRSGSLSKDVRQVAADGLEVIRRGHALDPRVEAPALAHALGGPADGLPPRLLYFAFWCAARDIAVGGDGLEIVRLLDAAARAAPYQPGSFGELLATGMADVLLAKPADLGRRWPEFAPKLRAILATLRSGAPRGPDIVLAVIKARLNGGRPGDPDVVQLDSPGAFDPTAASRPVQLRYRDRTLAAIALPALGPISREAFAAAAAAQLSRQPLGPAVRASACWRSPAFWSAAAPRLLRSFRLVATGALFGRRQALALGRAALKDALSQGLSRQVKTALLKAPAAPAIARAGSATVAAGRASRRRPRPGALAVPVLMYHRVAPSGAAPLDRYRVTPECFEAQLACLRDAGYAAIGPAELDAFLRLAAPLPERSVMLSFDDGYVDFAQHAWPLLRRYGFQASVFVVPGKVGGRADWDAQAGEAAPLMDWADLRSLAAEGVAIESHSLTHPALTTLSVGDLYREAQDSAAAIAAGVGRRPTAFCYPYGAHDVVVQRVVEECGYRIALTTEPGLCRLGAAPIRVPRVEVAGRDDLGTFRRKLGL